MRRFQTWALLVTLVTATYGTSSAGLPSFQELVGGKRAKAKAKAETPTTTQDAKTYNTKMAESIASALRNAGLSGYDIQIRFQSGKVALTGTISNTGQKAAVTRVVTGVGGVQAVDNQLKVIPVQPVAAVGTATKPAAVKPPTFTAPP